MYEKLADVHPLIAGAMKFINMGEDETLTRLAAEAGTRSFKRATELSLFFLADAIKTPR